MEPLTQSLASSAGRRTTITLPNSIIATYGFDAADQLTSITYMNGTTTVGTLGYGYDLGGRRTSMTGTLSGFVPPTVAPALTYDGTNRLTSRGGNSISYDASALKKRGSRFGRFMPNAQLSRYSPNFNADNHPRNIRIFPPIRFRHIALLLVGGFIVGVLTSLVVAAPFYGLSFKIRPFGHFRNLPLWRLDSRISLAFRRVSLDRSKAAPRR